MRDGNECLTKLTQKKGAIKMRKTKALYLGSAALALAVTQICAFQTKIQCLSVPFTSFHHHPPVKTYSSLLPLSMSTESSADAGTDIEGFLKAQFPEYYALLNKNPEVWKAVKQSTDGCTFFAPNSQAFDNLGEKKTQQMTDERNLEQVEKIATYHVIAEEALSEERLDPVKIEGVMTLGGVVPLGGKKTGGFFGFGAKDDGSKILGPNAKILQSFTVGNSVVYEVDDLVSPEIVWRYFDQLRIPGT